MAFFKDNEQLVPVGSRIYEANKVEVRFKGSNWDQGRKGAVLVRTRTGRVEEGERGAEGLLVELFRLYGNGDLTEEAPLMSFRGNDGWEVWSRGRANQCFRDGTASVGQRWERGGEGGETDFRIIRVAFGEDRRSDKTGRGRGTGGRNKERRKVVVRLVYGVR